MLPAAFSGGREHPIKEERGSVNGKEVYAYVSK